MADNPFYLMDILYKFIISAATYLCASISPTIRIRINVFDRRALDANLLGIIYEEV